MTGSNVTESGAGWEVSWYITEWKFVNKQEKYKNRKF